MSVEVIKKNFVDNRIKEFADDTKEDGWSDETDMWPDWYS